jgi:hypothetical protein
MMMQEPPRDPTVLQPAHVALHQLATFTPDHRGRIEALARSPFFRLRPVEHGAVAEWVRISAERDPSSFPLGRISVHPSGLLLEAFSERRMDLLGSAVFESGLGRVRADQLRVFPVAEALGNPKHLAQPLHDLTDDELTAREVAVLYLRMAWTYLPREDLRGRTPESVVGSGRGRAELERIVEGLPRELRSEFPSFPAFSGDELLDLLLPEEPAPAPVPASRPRSATPRRKD